VFVKDFADTSVEVETCQTAGGCAGWGCAQPTALFLL